MPFLAPIVASIGAAITSAFAGMTFGTFLVRVGATLLLGALTRRMAARSARGASRGWGTRGLTISDPLESRKIVYGNVRLGGVRVFENTSDREGAPASVLDQIIVLAGHQVAAIGNIYFDGKLAVPAGSNAGTGVYEGAVTVERALGHVDQSAFPGLRALLPSLWTADHRMRGVAGVWLRLIYDSEAGPNVFPTGRPNITFDITGKNDILDPRSNTRGFSANTALCLADYMSLPTRLSINAQIGAADGIDVDDLIEAANVCDEPVQVIAAGGVVYFEPRYPCNGVVDLGDTPQTNIELMLTAMAGECIPVGGAFTLRAGAYRAPNWTFTLDEAAADPKLITRVDLSENFNCVRGKFFSPENDWQPDDFPPLRSAVYVAEDGGEERWVDIELPFTTSAATAQRLAKIMLERARRQMTVEWPGQLSCWRAAADDAVFLTVPWWGFTAKPFEIHGMSLALEQGQASEQGQDGGAAPALLPTFVLRETSPLVFDWSASEAQIYAAAPRTNLPDPFTVAPTGNPVITETLYETRQGGGLKMRLRAAWSASPTGTASSYEVQARLGAGPWETLPTTRGLTAERSDATPGLWTVRVRAVTALGVRSIWSETQATLLGLAAPPAAVQRASIQSAGGLAVIKWALHPDLDVRIGGHIVIRHSASEMSWSSSLALDEVPGGQTIAIVSLMPGAYLLRARDSSGVLGPEVVLSTDGIQALQFQSVGTLQEDDEFSGVTANAGAVGGALQLVDPTPFSSIPLVSAVPSILYPSGQVASEGIYNFATMFDFGTLKAVRLRREVEAQTIDLALWPAITPTGGAEGDVRVEIATTADNPALAGAVWSGWRLLETTDLYARGIKARAILTTSDTSATPRVTRLRIHADEVA